MANVKQDNAPSAMPDVTMPRSAATHDEIAVRAYVIYMERGGLDGRDIDDWLEAERALALESATASRAGDETSGRMTSSELLVSWLQDAHAMEVGLPSALRRHASHAENVMPEVSSRLREHARQTEQHAERMRQALERLGAKPSLIKSTLSAMIGPVQGISTGLFSDAFVKDVLTDFATEQFEVACYTALIAATDNLGEIEVAALCRENLVEDEDMANWLEEQIPTAVRRTQSQSLQSQPRTTAGQD